MIRWFWRIYIPTAILALISVLALPLGPAIETRFFAPRVNNLNLHAFRTAEQVCWTWSSDKLRLLYSDDVDIHLDVLDSAGRVKITYVPPLLNMDTGQPWQSGLSIGLGHHEIRYCVEVPRAVKSGDRIRVRFTPIVHGWLSLWPLPIYTPDIVDPPD